MIVTGVQPVGARGVSSLQAAAVDTKEAARAVAEVRADPEHGFAARAGEPQPVVFPRDGVALDQRPVSQRLQHAAHRYEQDGGAERDERNPDHY